MNISGKMMAFIISIIALGVLIVCWELHYIDSELLNTIFDGLSKVIGAAR